MKNLSHKILSYLCDKFIGENIILKMSYHVSCKWCFKDAIGTKSIKFSFQPGDVVKFSDANGAGKSSFFNTIESVVDKCCRGTNLCGYNTIELKILNSEGGVIFDARYKQDESPPFVLRINNRIEWII
jgi:energy-coupling factor transporter ATP-binding protein EcfA2